MIKLATDEATRRALDSVRALRSTLERDLPALQPEDVAGIAVLRARLLVGDHGRFSPLAVAISVVEEACPGLLDRAGFLPDRVGLTLFLPPTVAIERMQDVRLAAASAHVEEWADRVFRPAVGVLRGVVGQPGDRRPGCLKGPPPLPPRGSRERALLHAFWLERLTSPDPRVRSLLWRDVGVAARMAAGRRWERMSTDEQKESALEAAGVFLTRHVDGSRARDRWALLYTDEEGALRVDVPRLAAEILSQSRAVARASDLSKRGSPNPSPLEVMASNEEMSLAITAVELLESASIDEVDRLDLRLLKEGVENRSERARRLGLTEGGLRKRELSLKGRALTTASPGVRDSLLRWSADQR